MSSEPIKVLLVEDNLGDARLLYEGLEEALPRAVPDDPRPAA